MTEELIYVGIDVAKDRVDVATRPADQHWSVSYDEAGVEALVAELQVLEPAAVILEATGGLELPLVAAVAAAALPVAVVNPRPVRDFARSTGQLAKNDSRNPTIEPPTWHTLPPPFTPTVAASRRALEGRVVSLAHISGALQPVWYGRPLSLGYGLDQVAQGLVLADGDGEAYVHLAADGDHGVGVEAAVGTHREWPGGSGMADPAHRLPQEVGGASGRVGAALTQPCHQHVAGARGHGEDRVIASLAGVPMVASSLLAQPVGLAEGGVQVDGQRTVAGSGPCGPRPGQQLPAHPVQLPRVAPPETPQEGPQGGWRLDHTPQHPRRPARPQRIGVVNAVAASQRRRHQGQHLVASVGSSGRIPQVNVAVHQFTQAQVVGQGDRQQQPRIGHQAVIIKGNVDAVGLRR